MRINFGDISQVFLNGTEINSIVINGEEAYSGVYPYLQVWYTDGTTRRYKVTSVGGRTVENESMVSEVVIGDKVTSIGNSVFSGCSGLTSITIDYNNHIYDSRDNCNAIIETSTNKLVKGCKNTVIPNSVTSITDSAFSGCSGLTSIIIPEGVTSIGDIAFSGCSGLTSIEIPNSVTSIGEGAFYNCSGLTSVIIPNSVTRVGYSVFRGCSDLTSVTIGNSVTIIGDYAFIDCYNLTSIICNPTTPPTISSNTIPSTINLIYVPDESVDAYKSATNWKSYASKIYPISQKP